MDELRPATVILNGDLNEVLVARRKELFRQWERIEAYKFS